MKNECIECGDCFEDFSCILCNEKIPKDSRCKECHNEIIHSVVEFNSGKPLFGGREDVVDDGNEYESIVPNITPQKME